MTIAQLLISDSEHHADMLYVSKLFVPDPFIAIGLKVEGGMIWHGLLSSLEVDRAQKKSNFDHVHLDAPWQKKASELGWIRNLASTAAAFLKEHQVSHVNVPGNFPLMYADILRELGFIVIAQHGTLFPQRAIKSEE